MTAIASNPQVTPAEAMAELDRLARELGQRGTQLANVERELEPIEAEYERFMADHEIGLWTEHEDGDRKWPSERVRDRLGHKAMPPELLGRYTGLVASRKRLEKRIGSLKAEVDAWRSIISTLRAEMEATMARHG